MYEKVLHNSIFFIDFNPEAKDNSIVCSTYECTNTDLKSIIFELEETKQCNVQKDLIIAQQLSNIKEKNNIIISRSVLFNLLYNCMSRYFKRVECVV